MPACSSDNSVLVSDSTKPISVSVLTTPGRLNVTSSVMFTAPALVLASSRTAHCITPAALTIRHQPGRSARDRQASRLPQGSDTFAAVSRLRSLSPAFITMVCYRRQC